MRLAHLSPQQQRLVESPASASLFVEGPAGAGKTTAAVARLLYLLAGGVPAGSLLVLVPQRTLGDPYYAAVKGPGLPPGGLVSILTVAGLAQRMAENPWLAIAHIRQAILIDADIHLQVRSLRAKAGRHQQQHRPPCLAQTRMIT